uniref:Putative secreted protein n=1 Tax=Rhipicephalus microplus TaxID=6941 RepID=A0A6G5A283_RHIMP
MLLLLGWGFLLCSCVTASLFHAGYRHKICVLLSNTNARKDMTVRYHEFLGLRPTALIALRNQVSVRFFNQLGWKFKLNSGAPSEVVP